MNSDAEPRDRALEDAVDDEVYQALQDRSRRIVLYVLLSYGTVGLDELADVVTGWLGVEASRIVTRKERDRVYETLADRHLPLLAAAGLVDYDVDEGTVSLSDLPQPVRSLLDATYAAEGG